MIRLYKGMIPISLVIYKSFACLDLTCRRRVITSMIDRFLILLGSFWCYVNCVTVDDSMNRCCVRGCFLSCVQSSRISSPWCRVHLSVSPGNDVVYSVTDSSHSDLSAGGTLHCPTGDFCSVGERLVGNLDYLGCVVEWGDGKSYVPSRWYISLSSSSSD